MTIELVSPQLYWSRHFQLEKIKLQKILEDELLDIEHIGSTSLGTIEAKNTIDIAVLVRSTEFAEHQRDNFGKNEYQWLGHSSTEDNGRRVIARKESNGVSIRIHLYPLKHANFDRVIRFRDMLLKCPKIASEYQDLKRNLVKQNLDSVQYHHGKTEFINEVVKLSLSEQPYTIQLSEESDFQTQTIQWLAQGETRFFAFTIPDQASAENPNYVREKILNRLSHYVPTRVEQIFTVAFKNEIIGRCNFRIGHKMLKKNSPESALVGLIIGDFQHRSKGLGSLMLKHLETKMKNCGAKRAEAGVFTFNEPSIRLFNKNSYVKFQESSNIQYFRGQMWPEFLFEKTLD